MKALLLTSLALSVIASLLIFSEQQASATPVIFNQTTLSVPFSMHARNATVYDSFGYAANGTLTQWWHATSGGSVIIGYGGTVNGTTRTLSCALSTTFAVQALPFVNGNIYYACDSAPSLVRIDHINTSTGVNTHDFTLQCTGAGGKVYITILKKEPVAWCTGTSPVVVESKSLGINQSSVAAATAISYNSEEIKFASSQGGVRWNWNYTSLATVPAISNNYGTDLVYIPNNATFPGLPTIAADIAVPANVTKYYSGMEMKNVNGFYTNSTLPFFTSINSNPYKKALTLVGPELGLTEPYVSFVFHNNNADWLFFLTSNNIRYVQASTLMHYLTAGNRAVQTYEIVDPTTTSSYQIPSTTPMRSLNTQITSDGNTTFSKAGMYTVTSGYSTKVSSILSAIRTIDPQWTNDNQDYPVIATNGTALFPIILTVTNAPTDAAIKVTNPYTVINNNEAIWSVTRLDSTHTAEFDMLPNQCPNVYVADNSIQPYVYIFEGTVCANGVNQKTIAYTATLPTSFYTQKYGATHSFTPSNNGLVVTTRASTFPYTYNVLIKNSTGAITQNFTKTVNGTIDIQNFNTTNATKSASLYVSIIGVGQIYQANLGSPLSFASTVAFFHQYFNYQGFDMLSFIPIIFASMFTRSTVGIGTALTVVCIASLSWLSIVVVPDTIIYVSIIIAIITMVGYRGYQYFG